MTPRRAWTAAIALAVVLLVFAFVVARVLEPHTRDFDKFEGLGIWKIDVHERIDPDVLGWAVNFAASQGILGIVNLGGNHAGGGLERHLEAARRFPGRVQVFMQLDERGCCDAAWIDRESARLVTGRAAGARGLHLPRPLVNQAGKPVPVDAPELEPLWLAVERLQIPVALRVGPRLWDRERFSSLLLRHSSIPFLALGMADLPGDPEAVGVMLGNHPNLLVDTGGAVPALGRIPERARTFLASHADRVLLGLEVTWLQGPREEQRAVMFGEGAPVRNREALLRYFDSTWRFLETREKDIPAPVVGDKAVEGLGLPRDVLEKLYRGNARRVLGFGDLGAQ